MSSSASLRRGFDAGSLYGLTATGIAVSRRGSGVIFCDDNYARILDREPKAILGLSMEDLTHPDDLKCNAWLLGSAMDEGRTFDIKKRYLLPNGDARWVENHISTSGGADETLIVVLSRTIPPPAMSTADESLRDYLSDMSAQLAAMAAQAGLVTSSEALGFASVLSAIEGS